MDGRPTWTDCDEAGDYVVPNVLSPRDLVLRPDNIDETVPHTNTFHISLTNIPKRYIHTQCRVSFGLKYIKQTFIVLY